MIDWKERYMREVEGLNNEGDPIGGDPLSGLRHQVEMLKKMVIALENQNNDYLNQIRKAGLIVNENFVQGSVMSDIKPVAYMFDHTIQNDETSITIKDRADIVNPLIMKIEGISSVSNIRPLYPASAYEALKAENEAQAKRIAELEDDNKYLKQLSFSAIDTSNQYEIKKKTLMHSLALLEKVTKHFTRVPSTLADSEIRSEVHAFLSESKNGDSK